MKFSKAAEWIATGIDLIPKESQKLILEKIFGNSEIADMCFDISSFCSSEEVMDYINQFRLYKVENLVRFFVELHFAAFDSVYSGIESVRNDLLNETIAEVIAEKRKMRIAYDNQEIKDSIMYECMLNLVAAISKLEKKIITYCSEIKRIDDRNAIEYFIKSNSDKNKVIEDGNRATTALQLYYEALKLLAVISNETSMDLSSCFNDAEEFARLLSEEGVVSLMIRYTKESYRKEWDSERINKQFTYIKELTEDLSDTFDEGEEIDFENLE